MKKTIIPLLTLFMASVISCQKDGLNPYEEKGSLCIDIGLDVRVKEVNNKLKAGQTDNFKVIVYHASGIEAMIFATASLMPDTIELVPGDYYVVAHSDNNLPAAFENPYYYGESEIFSISSNQQQSVQVNCTLANTIVSVTYTDTTRNSFEDYTTTVSTSLDSLVYNRDETRWGYFQPDPMQIRVDLTYLDTDGIVNNKTISGTIPNPVPNKHPDH